jgi:hypothetical protein
MGRFDAMDELVEKLGNAERSEWDAIRQQLLDAARALPDPKTAIEHLEAAKKGINNLEARWEVDEVIEVLTPEPEAAPEPEEEAPDPNKPLTSADLDLIYDDPRGIRLHRSKVGDRYFLTQVDPRTYQPQTFELRPEEVTQLKAQLEGSPYWLIGA